MKSNIEYLKVFMEYESDDMPVVYFYEVDLDNERLTIREIEVYPDGQTQLNDKPYLDVIEICPIPTANELNSGIWGEGFFAAVISKEEFYEIWNSGVYSGSLTAPKI